MGPSERSEDSELCSRKRHVRKDPSTVLKLPTPGHRPWSCARCCCCPHRWLPGPDPRPRPRCRSRVGRCLGSRCHGDRLSPEGSAPRSLNEGGQNEKNKHAFREQTGPNSQMMKARITFGTFAGVTPLPSFSIIQNVDDQGGKLVGTEPGELLAPLNTAVIRRLSTASPNQTGEFC